MSKGVETFPFDFFTFYWIPDPPKVEGINTY
jgi:hypothetical protein